MADMKKVYDDLIIINLYAHQKKFHFFDLGISQCTKKSETLERGGNKKQIEILHQIAKKRKT